MDDSRYSNDDTLSDNEFYVTANSYILSESRITSRGDDFQQHEDDYFSSTPQLRRFDSLKNILISTEDSGECDAQGDHPHLTKQKSLIKSSTDSGLNRDLPEKHVCLQKPKSSSDKFSSLSPRKDNKNNSCVITKNDFLLKPIDNSYLNFASKLNHGVEESFNRYEISCTGTFDRKGKFNPPDILQPVSIDTSDSRNHGVKRFQNNPLCFKTSSPLHLLKNDRIPSPKNFRFSIRSAFEASNKKWDVSQSERGDSVPPSESSAKSENIDQTVNGTATGNPKCGTSPHGLTYKTSLATQMSVLNINDKKFNTPSIIPKSYTKEEMQKVVRTSVFMLQEKYLKLDRKTSQEVAKTKRDNEKLSILCRSLRFVVEELVDTMTRMSVKNNAMWLKMAAMDHEKSKLKDDVRNGSEDMQRMENAFCQLLKRYEKCKDALKLCMEKKVILRKNLAEEQQKYSVLEERTREVLKRAKNEIEKAMKYRESEVIVLEVQVQRSELVISRLENQLEHMKKQLCDLYDTYDDLMSVLASN